MLDEHGGTGEIVGEDVLKFHTELVRGVEAEECVAAGREDVYVVERDVAVDGQKVTGEGGVERGEDKGILDVADADVAVGDVLYEAASAAVRLDAKAVVRAVDGEIVDQHVIDAAAGSAADGHAVAGIEVVVQDRDIGC